MYSEKVNKIVRNHKKIRPNIFAGLVNSVCMLITLIISILNLFIFNSNMLCGFVFGACFVGITNTIVLNIISINQRNDMIVTAYYNKRRRNESKKNDL